MLLSFKEVCAHFSVVFSTQIWLQVRHAALYLHGGGGAAYPPVVLVYQAAQAERPPRLLQVAMQVPYCNQARHRRQHRGVCFVL